MLRHARPTLAACAVGIPTALLLSGCGGLSADSVASVDGKDITKAQYDQNLKFATFQVNGPAALQGKNPKLIVPRPPDYKSCIADIRAQIPKPQKGQPATPDSQLKQQCEQAYDQMKQIAFESPIVQLVVAKEAEDNDVKVTDAELQKGWDAYLAQPNVLGGKQNLAKYKSVAGLTEEPLRKQQKTDALLQKLNAKIVKDRAKVSDKDVEAYYEKNKAQYTTPETRGLHIVLTKTEAKAQAAKRELDGGAKFADVAKKYSEDQVSKNAGGKLSGVTKGQQERGLEQAAFAAKKDEIVGPVKTESGYYVVRVDSITPAKVTPFAQVKELLKQRLVADKQSTAWTDWQEEITKKWRKKTECRDGYTSTFCKGYKEPTTPAPAPGAGEPQQAPAQPAQ